MSYPTPDMLPRCCWFRSPGGTIFVISAAASRRLSGSARGIDFDPSPERPCGTARPRCRSGHLHRHRDAAVSPVALGGSTSTRPRSGRAGRRVLVAGLAAFVLTTVATPAAHPCACRAQGLVAVGRVHPCAARACFPPCCALPRPEHVFASSHTIFAS